jgi:twitching motility protein PilI
MSQEYFCVSLSPDISLAIPLSNMGEVTQLASENICIVPGIAQFWHGAVNFKGSLLWVLDSDRYFNLTSRSKSDHKQLTAVIIKPSQNENSQKLALTTPKLLGIITPKAEELAQIADNELFSVLKQCCSATIQDQSKQTFILNPDHLLAQLYQQSSLVSA